jgi:hypothetical protein
VREEETKQQCGEEEELEVERSEEMNMLDMEIAMRKMTDEKQWEKIKYQQKL